MIARHWRKAERLGSRFVTERESKYTGLVQNNNMNSGLMGEMERGDSTCWGGTSKKVFLSQGNGTNIWRKWGSLVNLKAMPAERTWWVIQWVISWTPSGAHTELLSTFCLKNELEKKNCRTWHPVQGHSRARLAVIRHSERVSLRFGEGKNMPQNNRNIHSSRFDLSGSSQYVITRLSKHVFNIQRNHSLTSCWHVDIAELIEISTYAGLHTFRS